MYWIIIAIILFIIEMCTGTFYLLIISASFASAGLAWWLFETSSDTNAMIAIFCSVLGIIFVRFWLKKRQHTRHDSESFNHALNCNQPVVLVKPLQDHLWEVQYRGTIWQAYLQNETKAKIGTVAYITGQKGNTLFINLTPTTKLGENKIV